MKTRPRVCGRLLRAATSSHKFWSLGEGRPVHPVLDPPLQGSIVKRLRGDL